MDEEDANATMSAAAKKLGAEGEELKKDIEDLERSLAKAEQEKNTKETQIKSLQDEMAQQDELIAKLTREKKKMEEGNRVSDDDAELAAWCGCVPVYRSLNIYSYRCRYRVKVFICIYQAFKTLSEILGAFSLEKKR